MEWWYARCMECDARIRGYRPTLPDCPECGSEDIAFEGFHQDCECDCDPCDDCKRKVGMMKTYNVIASVGVDVEIQVQAESESDARLEAAAILNEGELEKILRDSDYYSTSEPEIVDLWEIEDED